MNTRCLRIIAYLLTLSFFAGPLYAAPKVKEAESSSFLTRPSYMLPPDESLYAIAFDSARPLTAAILAFSAAASSIAMGSASAAMYYTMRYHQKQKTYTCRGGVCFLECCNHNDGALLTFALLLDGLNFLQTAFIAPFSSYLVKTSAVWPSYKYHLAIDVLGWAFYIFTFASYGFIWLTAPLGVNKRIIPNTNMIDTIPIFISAFGATALVFFGIKGIITYKMASYMQKKEQNSQVAQKERVKILPTAAPLINRRGQMDGASGGVALVF